MIPQLQHAQRSFGPGSGPAKADQPEEGAAFTRLFGRASDAAPPGPRHIRPAAKPAEAPDPPPEAAADPGADAAPAERAGPAASVSADAEEGSDPAREDAAQRAAPDEGAQDGAGLERQLTDMPFLIALPGQGASITAPADPQILFAIAAAGEEGVALLRSEAQGPAIGDPAPDPGAQPDAATAAVARPASAALFSEPLAPEDTAPEMRSAGSKTANIKDHAPALPPLSAQVAATAAPMASPGLAAMITALAPPETRPRGSSMETALRLNMDAGSAEGAASGALSQGAQPPVTAVSVAAAIPLAAGQALRRALGESATVADPAPAFKAAAPAFQAADPPAASAAGPAPAPLLPVDGPILFSLTGAEPGLAEPAAAGRQGQAQGMAQAPMPQVSLPMAAVPGALLDHALQTSAGKAGGGPVEVVLNPQELGRMRFEMHQQGDHLRVFLVAERPETLDLLRRHGEQLLSDLRQSGFGGASLSFGSWGQQAGDSQAQILAPDGPPPEDVLPVTPSSLLPRLLPMAPGAGLDLRF